MCRPSLGFPLEVEIAEEDDVNWRSEKKPFTPHHLQILDLIQFCNSYVAKPISGTYHSFFQHHHLTFDTDAGQSEFRNKINKIFQRNGIAYEIKNDGKIIRLAPTVLSETLHNAYFSTSDNILNEMLSDARSKFLNPDIKKRKESLERLWDAWERIKTVIDPTDKRKSIDLLLNKSAGERKFRELLELEAK